VDGRVLDRGFNRVEQRLDVRHGHRMPAPRGEWQEPAPRRREQPRNQHPIAGTVDGVWSKDRRVGPARRDERFLAGLCTGVLVEVSV
jgi:hypothetical protein